ncbi:MAG: response regulator transcription factor, partial [Lachnospira sp.]|jgi:two-component system LytT family response regulator|nr:response regulator transcription factor [Lachnospira sp.]
VSGLCVKTCFNTFVPLITKAGLFTMDKLYRVVIIDDDEFSADNLCLELKKYNRLSIDGMARNGVNGRKLLEKVHPDLLFLDVELPDMKGMELLEQIRGAITWNMQIVFYTAYDKYMIYAIRGAAFDYLLKPIDKKELEGIIDRFMKKEEESAAASLAIPARVHSVGEHTFMISTPTNDLRILRSIDIGFFRYNSDRKLWEVVLNNQLPLLLKKNTTADHIKGYDPCFVQIHQSYIININYLMMIKENRCVMFPPFENITELQVSKKFRKELQDRFYLL